MKRAGIILALVLMTAPFASSKQTPGSQATPEITGNWVGTWSAYNPARESTPPQEQCAKLSAAISRKGEIWEAVFEGDCGRPYKYTITMEGRAVGGAVLFKGSADLGARDGGVYDWIGRAVNDEFVGFYTSAGYTGVFSLMRAR